MHSLQVMISLTYVGNQDHLVQRTSDLKLRASHLSLSSPADNKSMMIGVSQARYSQKIKILSFGMWQSVVWCEIGTCQHTGEIKLLPPSSDFLSNQISEKIMYGI
jgi:hypothetical protein